MGVLIVQDFSVELATQSGYMFKDIPHLVLEIKVNGQEYTSNLTRRQSTHGTWETDLFLFLFGVDTVFTVHVLIELDGNDRQLVGWIELKGTDLYNNIGPLYENPLMSYRGYPKFILRMKVSAKELIMSEIGPQRRREDERAAILDVISDGRIARQAFEKEGNMQSLEQAISKFEAAVEMVPQNDPELPYILDNLGFCFFRRFIRLGGLEDIDKSIERLEVAVGLTPDSDRDKPVYLCNLGSCLKVRFERLKNNQDLDAAILHQRAAINLFPDNHPEKPPCLNKLGNALKTRFKLFENIADIDSAIVLQQAAVNLTPTGDPSRPHRLSVLGNAFLSRFQRTGNLADINCAVTQHQAAISLIRDSDPEKASYLTSLGVALLNRFERLGNIADIDGAITQHQSAVNLTLDGDPDKPGRLGNLGHSILNRFRRLGNLADINESVDQQQAAAKLTPDGHPDKASHLTNLGNSLFLRFGRLGNRSDLDAAITHYQAAVDLTSSDHPNKPIYHNNLGLSLGDRFEQLKNPADIDNSIIQRKLAVTLTPNDHPNKRLYLNNLGISLHNRALHTGSREDEDNAILQHLAALNLTPDDHPGKAGYLGSLGLCFFSLFLQSRHTRDAESAIYHLSTAARFSRGPPTACFEAALRWIHIASLIRHQSLLAAYECAIGLMPGVAWLGLPITDRHSHLVEIGGLARDAAAAAISLGQYEKALEWLEQGRSIVWTQVLQLRTPVDGLRDVDSNLADRLVQVSRLLHRDLGQDPRSSEEYGQRYRELTGEWESIIGQIRSLPNLEDFLKPPQSSRLKGAARDGEVVILNVAKERCDALALLAGIGEVIHIPLPGITYERVVELRDELKDLLHSKSIRMRGQRAARKWTDEDDNHDCRNILAELWIGLVKPVLDSLSLTPNPSVLPRLWWCATGPLAFLPIHAAGIYDQHSAGPQLSDYAISSYIPTLSSLLEPTHRTPDSSFKLLSVVQPSAPGVTSIPNTVEELECIQRRLGCREHIVLNGQEGTKRRVMKEMELSNWVHLACHGVQKPEEPTESALILEDGHLKLKELIKLDLPKAEFAFLSACQTMTGDENLFDEAVHIAGGMLLAGYRGVVATMWSIEDELAPKIADEFYRHIMENPGRPDSRRAAEALHYSIQKLRKEGVIHLTSWIPFVHLGV